MKNILMINILALMFFSANSSFSEVVGTISNPEGNAIPAVSVRIPELKKQVSTNAKGEFLINDIEAGTYNFKMTRAGCRPLDTIITIAAGKNALSFVMFDVYQIKQNVVVTGTRTAKQIERNPIATDVVTGDNIRNTGHLRLDNVLNEELGTLVVDGHGKGVQIQGLDPEYALILVNGEPLIGRNGGVLDISRLPMGNVQRIEVVKGPSSSLYGSNALAGVINIITNEPPTGFSLRTNARYESFNTIDIGAETGINLFDDKVSNNFFVNRQSSDGYKLTEERFGKAVPKYTKYSLSNDFIYKFTPRTSIKFGMRVNTEDQENYFDVTRNDSLFIIDDNGKLRDIGLSINAKHQYTDFFNIEARAYYTMYGAETKYNYRETGDYYDNDSFDQSLAKLEFQWNWMLKRKHILTFGGGTAYEDVKTPRYNNKLITTNAFYAFLQEDWLASKSVNVIGSLRYDWHSDYSDNFSPKIAASWELFDGFTLKGSVGSGFKAPSFQQLYLDWTNSIAGYSVFGVAFFHDRFQKLVDDNVITNVIVDISKISDLKPESSFSFNFGFNWDILDGLDTKINLFRNNINDMIEVAPVADKNNGSQVWSYFNLKKVYTQGMEMHLRFSPLRQFNVSIGYQFLEAIDVDVLNEIKAGKVFMRTKTGDRVVKPSEYGGLMNRSRHSANMKIEYNNHDLGFNCFLRGTFRGRYGFRDLNASNILDADNEYAPSYFIWNITLSQELLKHFQVQLGVDNIFDKFDPIHIVSNPGRTFYANVVYRFSSNK